MTKEDSPHRQHKRERMVAQILETARQIMREEGVAALSMQELARRMDLRAPSLYNYFSGKMELFDALFRLGFTLFDEHITASVQGAQNWQQELRLMMESYMTFAQQNPELYQLCFERPVPGFVPSEESLQVSFGLLRKSYARVAGWLPTMDVNLSETQMADMLIAMMHGLTALHLANEPDRGVGEGRFGSLIPEVVTVFEKAWKKS